MRRGTMVRGGEEKRMEGEGRQAVVMRERERKMSVGEEEENL
jgi:hypothetical protein